MEQGLVQQHHGCLSSLLSSSPHEVAGQEVNLKGKKKKIESHKALMHQLLLLMDLSVCTFIWIHFMISLLKRQRDLSGETKSSQFH